MPYISARVSNKLDEATIQKLQEQLTHEASNILGKPKGAVMVGIEHGANIFMGGDKLDNGAYIELKAYGKSTPEAKESINKAFNKALNQITNVDSENVYITFADKSEWGYKGGFLK